MRTGLIYKIISPSNKTYIGQTVDIKKRLYCYKNARCKNQPKIYKSILKYGFINHIFEIIEENIIVEDLDRKEEYYIELFDCFNKGLNSTKYAKVPMRGRKFSIETRNKMSIAHKGIITHIRTKQQNENMSLILKQGYSNGRIHPNKGKSVSDEIKLKIGKGNKGKKCSDDKKLKISLAKRKITLAIINQVLSKIDEGVLLKHVASLFNLSTVTISKIKKYKKNYFNNYN